MGSLVTILTPCFAHEKYLADYFESLLLQTWREIEIVFCDDASPDGSWSVAQKYRTRLEERFCRVVLLRNEENFGLLRTLERMKTEVRGEIVSILESDDYLYPTKVEDNVAFLHRHPEIGLIHSDADYLVAGNYRLDRFYWRTKGGVIPTGDVYYALIHDNFVLTCTAAFRASLFLEHADFASYRERGYRAADYPMYLDIARHAPFGYLDRALAVYRILEGSISHPKSVAERLEWRLNYCQVKRDYARDPSCPEKVRRRAETHFYSTLMRLGWVSGSAEKLLEAHDWLLAHEPARFRRWDARIRRLMIRSGVLWRAARWLEALTRQSGA